MATQKEWWEGLGTAAPRIQLNNFYGGASTPSLSERFGKGFIGAIRAVTREPLAQLRDMGAAGLSVAYNELFRKSSEPMWFPEQKSDMANAYANGVSQTELLLSSNPYTGVSVMSYHATTALMNGDWGSLSEMAGGLAGGFAIGAGTQKYGHVGLTMEGLPSSYLSSQRGAISNFKLVGFGENQKMVDINSIDYGAHLRGLIGEPPANMFDPHAHHTLFKAGNGPIQKALVSEGQSILRSYEIDPILGAENLTWAPNRITGQHDVVALRNVVDNIRAVRDVGGSRLDVIEKLQELGQLAAQRK